MDKTSEEKPCAECNELIRANAEICPKCGVRQHGQPGGFSDLDKKTILGFPFLTLQQGEIVLSTARRHWFPYVLTAFILTGFTDYTLGQANAGLIAIVVFSAIIFAVCFWLFYLARLTSVMIVTNRRVVTKTGLINIKTLEFGASKIETVGFIQNFIGQVLDFGTLIIIGTGGTREKIRDIEHPLELRKTVVSKLQDH